MKSETKKLINNTYQGLKVKCRSRADMEREIDQFLLHVPPEKAEAAQAIRKELSKMLKKDKDFK